MKSLLCGLKAVIFATVAILCGNAFGATDENGLEPLVWTTFDNGTVDNQGGVTSFSWGDNVVNYEDCGAGKAAYPSKYPYYNNQAIWGSATSFTLVGRFKAQGATSDYACLFGMGWNNDCVSVGAKQHGIEIAWLGNIMTTAAGGTLTAGTLTKEDVSADLTAGYHDYILVYDNSANSLMLYLDGVCALTKNDVKIDLTNNQTKKGGLFGMGGGAISGGPARNAQTRCDDYRIYGATLSETQIKRIAGLGLAADGWSTKADYNLTPTTHFTTGDGKTAWMTAAGNESNGSNKSIDNANGSDQTKVTFQNSNAEADKWHPYWGGLVTRNQFSISAYIKLGNQTISDSRNYGVIWAFGWNNKDEVILAVDANGNLVAGNMSSGVPGEGKLATIAAEKVTAGWHLVTVEFSTEFGTAITLDDGSAERTTAVCASATTAPGSNGFQIGAVLGGVPGQCGRADNVGISDVYYYDGLLAKGAISELVGELAVKYPTAAAEVGGVKYATLDAALGEATSGQTIKLLKSVSLASNTTLPTGTNLEILENVALDTAGFTFAGELNGAGKIVYHGAGTAPNYTFPANPTLGSNWTGICSFTDFCTEAEYTQESAGVQFHPDNFANENSKIEFNGVKFYIDQSSGYKAAEIIVTDKGSIPGWVIYNGWSHYISNFKKLSGTGTVFSKWNGDQRYVFASASGFEGNITISRDSARGPKIIVGTGDIPAQSDNGPQVVILSDAEMTMPATKNWTAKSGIKVDGTLNFAAETSGTARFFLSPLSGSGTINLATPSSGQTKIVFTNAAQDFVGSIAAKQHAHFVFAEAGKSSTSMAFNNSGYVCIETGTATLADGKTWSGTGSSGYGVFMESSTTLKLAGANTITGKLYVKNGGTLQYLDYGTTAVSGNIEPGNVTINVTIPEATPTGDFPKTLLTWSGTLSSGVNFNLTNSRGYLLQVEDHALKLIAPAEHVWAGTTGDICAIGNWDDGSGETMFSGESHSVRFPAEATVKTINVASGATFGTITVDGAYTFTGNGTVNIYDLQIADGATLRLEAGAKINFSQALSKDALSKITFAGGSVSAKSVPHFTQAENLTVDPTAYTTQGGYELISWTDFMTNGEFGYGLPKLNTNALNPAATITNHATDTLGELDWGNGSKARLLGMYGHVYIEVRTAEQLARKPIRILPLGDSITEGYNGSGNCANYRTQLAAKLSMAGYMVETLGYHYVRSRMPSGEWAPLEWQKHAGVSAQRVWTQTVNGSSNARAGDVEAIGPTLNMCGGTPDVVLVKLGTNDMGQNAPDTADRIYEGVFKIIDTIHARFPEAQVIVTTTVQYKSGNAIRQAFNGKLRTYFDGDHPAWLHLVDQCKNVGNGSAEGSYNDAQGRRLFYSDNVHPDWAGHDLMAKGWYDKIVELFDVDDGKDKPTKPVYSIGAAANVPKEYLTGFKKVRKLEIAEEACYPQTAFDGYTWKATTDPTSIEKVGYYMELVRKDTGVHKYVWVDMDKFADTVDAMGLPTTANHQQVVTKLHVASNMEGVHTIAANVDTETGYIEFSPFDATCTEKSGEGIPTQAWACMDWNDTLASSGNGRGCMQVHRVFPSDAKPDGNAGEVLFAYNNWGNANTGVAGTKAGEIGIGNFAQHYMSDTTANGNGVEINTLYGNNSISIYNNSHISIDYTATRFSPVGDMVNAKAYEVRNLEIWVKVAGETTPTYDEVTEDTPLADIVPGITADQLAVLEAAGVKATDIAAWAKEKGGQSGSTTIGGEGAINLEAFALNCAPTDLETEKANFKVEITIDAEGVHVEIPSADYNIDPVVRGSTTVNGVYELSDKDPSARFFRAFIEL